MTEAEFARLLQTISLDPETGCWLKQGSLTKGYGMMMIQRKLRYTHRLTYEHFIGPIPDGLQIDHLCRRRACCNPGHLEAVTPAVNNRRGLRGSLKTTCRNGHPWIAENIGQRKNGRRFCLLCKRELQRATAAATRKKSPYLGAHWDRTSWRGIYYRGQKQIYVGRFSTPEEARDAVALHRASVPP